MKYLRLKFKPAEMLHPVTWQAVTHVSKDHATFNFTLGQSKESVYPDDEESTILQNASNYSPISVRSQKTCLFGNTPVVSSKPARLSGLWAKI